MFRLCLMKYGVGRWTQIHSSGLLPGKLIGQLCGQAQRLLGQQSLACEPWQRMGPEATATHTFLTFPNSVSLLPSPAFTGLKVDIDRVRLDNEQRTDVQRKSGLLIYSGPPPSRELKQQWRKASRER